MYPASFDPDYERLRAPRAAIDKIQRVRLRQNERYNLEYERPFQLHHHLKKCGIKILQKLPENHIIHRTSGHENLAFQRQSSLQIWSHPYGGGLLR